VPTQREIQAMTRHSLPSLPKNRSAAATWPLSEKSGQVGPGSKVGTWGWHL